MADRRIGDDGLSFRSAELIDHVCDTFEKSWLGGGHPRIEDYLQRLPEVLQPTLLGELLAVEIECRVLRGESPTAEDYASRFPDSAIVAEIFSRRARGTTLENSRRSSDDSGSPRDYPPGTLLGGRYRIEERLGHGGCGVVYVATDEYLQRRVALKMPRRGPLAIGLPWTELLEEARTASRLEHESIVSVQDVGQDADGSGFLVMPYMEGGSLESRLGGVRPWEETASLLATVAAAVQFAHEHRFLHRDLKPSNILFDSAGRPHVADFGLAVHIDAQASHAGEFSGTLAYMAPEQVRGEVQHLDGRADIWALGVMLYQLLVGRLPFDGPSQATIADQILHGNPRPPRQLDGAVPRELERICLKCLELEPRERYATAADLASDLRRWHRPNLLKRALLPALLLLTAMTVALLVWHAGTQAPLPPAPTRVVFAPPRNTTRPGKVLELDATNSGRTEDELRLPADINFHRFIARKSGLIRTIVRPHTAMTVETVLHDAQVDSNGDGQADGVDSHTSNDDLHQAEIVYEVQAGGTYFLSVKSPGQLSAGSYEFEVRPEETRD